MALELTVVGYKQVKPREDLVFFTVFLRRTPRLAKRLRRRQRVEHRTAIGLVSLVQLKQASFELSNEDLLVHEDALAKGPEPPVDASIMEQVLRSGEARPSIRKLQDFFFPGQLLCVP